MNSSQRDPERGAAAVEFALVAMLLLTILFGVFEGGRLGLLQSTLSAAARDGAREMSIHNDSGEAHSYLTDRLASVVGAGDTLSVAVTPPGDGCTTGGKATAVATLTTSTMTGLLDPVFGGSITLTGTGVMRCNG